METYSNECHFTARALTAAQEQPPTTVQLPKNTVVKTSNSTDSFLGCEARTDSSSFSSSHEKMEVKIMFVAVEIRFKKNRETEGSS